MCYASAYNEAIVVAIRRGAPLASLAIDRRSLYTCCQGVRDDTVETLVCFWCERRFPYRRTASQNPITWHDPAMRVMSVEAGEGASVEYDFLGVPPEATENMFGLEAYLDKYGQCEADGPDLRQHPEEYEDLYLDVPFTRGTVRVLCCPEDRDCEDTACKRGSKCCAKCRIPVCIECDKAKIDRDGKYTMPPSALVNDLMIFYAPKELYTRNVTILEMICASPCLTSMICFSLEKKYRGERAFDEQVHMNRHRKGARGNATSFPLPWQYLLQQLQEDAPDLPHTGEALSSVVSVLLKTSEEGDSKESLARFTHQALVRRDVVISRIENAYRRGQRAYRHLDIQERAQGGGALRGGAVRV